MNFTSITVKSTRIRFLKLVVLGATLSPDDLSNIGKKNMARGVNKLKKNTKGNVGKDLFVFLDSGFFLVLKQNLNFYLPDLEHALSNKSI